MNKKGFTLVELLAVIVILASIALVVVSSISSSLDKQSSDECEQQKKLAVNAAKIYFSLADSNLTEVTLSTLKSGGYINEKSKTDNLDIDSGKVERKTVDMGGGKSKEVYEYVGSCK